MATTAMAMAGCSKPVIGFKSSQLTPLKVSCPPSAKVSFSSASGPLLVQPVASRVCDLTGKRANNGYKVSFSKKRTKTLQYANLQYKRLWWEEGKRFVKLRLSTKALKTVEKKGLAVMAKEAGIDLNKC